MLNIKLIKDFVRRIKQILVGLLSWFYKIPRFDLFNIIIINRDSLFLLGVITRNRLVFFGLD
jgi:hypothetical protein